MNKAHTIGKNIAVAEAVGDYSIRGT